MAHAVARKDKASVEEMQAVVGMQLLEVLLIVTRSQANRQRLLALGLLRALATAMKVTLQVSGAGGQTEGGLVGGGEHCGSDVLRPYSVLGW